MSDDLPIPGGPVIPAAELTWSASRASGPGGQHVNKTSTRITLAWSVADSAVLTDWQRQRIREKLAGRIARDGILRVHVDENRSQLRNRALAAERLAGLIAGALTRQATRRPTRPSRGSKERRLKSKKVQGQKKADRRRKDW